MPPNQPAAIRLIVGLGNPGSRYAESRHNAGFQVVDEVARRSGVGDWQTAHSSLLYLLPETPAVAGLLWLAKPLTYMNRSGSAVIELMTDLELTAEQILVVVDDIDLPLGRLRLRASGGSGSHNGLRDIVDGIGTSFARLRVGVRGDEPWDDLAEYVLSEVSAEEKAVVELTVARAADAVQTVLSQGIKPAMDRFNRSEQAPNGTTTAETTKHTGASMDAGKGTQEQRVSAIRFHSLGGPEVLQLQRIQVPAPGPGAVRIRHTAIGINFIDTYHRSGLYEVPLPATPGMEAAGVVEEIGAGVSEVSVGERVAYACQPPGAYAEARNLPAHRLVVLPDDIPDQVAAAAMLKGMTAQYLLRRTYRVTAGDTILVHAAAGGVGLILCQWAAHLGATVIGTVGSEDKAELAAAHGCHHPIVYTRDDWVARVRELTGGKGLPVVYDSVGQATWEGSLDSLQSLGLMVSFGNASGAVPPFRPVELAAKGSLFLTRPTLMSYTACRRDLLATATDLLEVLRSGAVTVEVRRTYPLAEAAQAHRDLESRRTSGSGILLPGE